MSINAHPMTFSVWLASAFGDGVSPDGRDAGHRRVRELITSPEPPDTLLDPEFPKRIRSGDPIAFEQLFIALYAGLVRFATRLTGSQEMAEDLVMDVFRRIWERREDWAPENARVYLYGAVRNAAATAQRDLNKRREILEGAGDQPVGMSESSGMEIHQQLFEQERLESLRLAIEQLPERQRLAFTLRREQGLTNMEVAKVLGIAVKTVEKDLTAAFKALRAALNEHLENL